MAGPQHHTTEVHFFVCEGTGDGVLRRAVCRIVDDAWQATPGLTVLIRVADEAVAAALDDELWTFRDSAFIPHRVAPPGDGGAPSSEEPVLITTGPPPLASFHPSLFVDATAQTDADTLSRARVPRVAMVLDADPARRAAGRDRFREWRSMGLTPQTTTLA